MRILITRPKHQAGQLVKDLEYAGYQADCLPLLDIVANQFSSEQQEHALASLGSADKLIAVSANAVSLSLPLLSQAQIPQPFFCIGPSTAAVLQAEGYQVRIPEDNYNSESLLQLPEFEQVKGQAIAILCGQGGRNYLENRLAELGARVHRVELYSRQPIEPENLEIDGMDIPDVMTAMSGDSAEALARALDLTGRGEWKSLPLVVPGNRVRAIAEGLGFDQIVATEKPTTAALLEALNKIPGKAR